MVALAGDFCLVDEAQHVGLVGAFEHDFHGHGAVDGALAGIEDRAHAALRDHAADGVALFGKQLLRQMPRDGGLGRRERDAGLGRRALAADFEGDVRAEADALVWEKARGFRDGPVVDKGAVAGGEVF